MTYPYLADVPTLSPESIATFCSRKVSKAKWLAARRELKRVKRLIRKAREKAGKVTEPLHYGVVPFAIGKRIEVEARKALAQRRAA